MKAAIFNSKDQEVMKKYEWEGKIDKPGSFQGCHVYVGQLLGIITHYGKPEVSHKHYSNRSGSMNAWSIREYIDE